MKRKQICQIPVGYVAIEADKYAALQWKLRGLAQDNSSLDAKVEEFREEVEKLKEEKEDLKIFEYLKDHAAVYIASIDTVKSIRAIGESMAQNDAFIKEHRNDPQFIFLYNVHTDHMGHKYAWMSPEYIQSIEEGDVQVGRMVEFLKKEGLYEDTHIFFITDHGGIAKGHGGVSPEEMIIPWVIKGPGIKQGFTITEANNTVNTASTVVRLFGGTQPLCWTGEVPESIFV